MKADMAQPAPVTRESLRAVALFEALKGAFAVAAALGLLALLHRDLQHFAVELVDFLHLDHHGRGAVRIISAFDRLESFHPAMLIAVAAAYAAVRFVEAYGLWHGLLWAEWFAAISGGLYIPFEVEHVVAGNRVAIALAALAVNLVIVGLMVYALWARRRARMA